MVVLVEHDLEVKKFDKSVNYDKAEYCWDQIKLNDHINPDNRQRWGLRERVHQSC